MSDTPTESCELLRTRQILRGGFLIAAFAMAVWMTAQSALGAENGAGYRVVPAADGSGWDVYEGNQLVAGYLFRSGNKPIVFPLHSPTGVPLTRGYPMVESIEHEREDHPHHRSLWLTHGEVNGIDFWLDDPKRNCGVIAHRDGSATVEDGVAVIVTENDWLAPDGKRLLSDRRRLTFATDEGRRILDCDFVLLATDGDVHFGDTKEGSFGIRVAGSMKVDAGLGGTIVNSEGTRDKATWGEKASWVDYTGPVGEAMAGITAHYHPSSHGYPCRWHVRTYGLFAANPFGVYHFVGGDRTEGFTLPAGESLRMHLRLVLHDGTFHAGRAQADFDAYGKTARPTEF